MSEDDRAAKAARAKAMLKKRQQKKTGATPNSVATPGSPISRPFSPALSETLAPATEDERSDFGDVFTKTDSDKDGSWLVSLPRASSPPLPAAIPDGRVNNSSSPQIAARNGAPGSAPSVTSHGVDTLQAELREQQQTISNLLSEKASLEASVDRLRPFESKVNENESSLLEERKKTQALEHDLRVLQESISEHLKEKASLDSSLKRLEGIASKSQQQDILLDEEQQKSSALTVELHNQRETISFLVSEKASLTASLEHMHELESGLQLTDSQLKAELSKSQTLEAKVRELQLKSDEAAKHVDELVAREKDLTEKHREQERERQRTGLIVSELRSEVEQHQRRAHELEEQIQNDDSVERLETSLRNTQDRADELEFQMSKLQQAHSTLKTEREVVERRLSVHKQSESEWKNKHDRLREELVRCQQELTTTTASQDALSSERSAIQAQLGEARQSAVDLQKKLGEAVSTLTEKSRQLQVIQAEHRNAIKRADEAERIQKDLQAEGTSLMRSLDEMRPKIVELTDSKLELIEKNEGLAVALRGRDAAIAQLETSLDLVTQEKEEAIRERSEIAARTEKERLSAEEGSTELHRAYSEMQSELDAVRAGIQSLEAERANHHRIASGQMEEVNRLTASSRAQDEELAVLRQELEEQRRAMQEERGLHEQVQNEMDILHSELSSRDNEIQRLRETSISSPSSDAPRSLDDEMLSSLQQQHELDLSAAQSQIRSLETSVFEAEGKALSLQKQLRSLEDEVVHLRSTSRVGQRPFSPGIPSRPSSRALSYSDLRRTSFTTHRPSALVPPPSRSMFDLGLSADTRHKRQVSLGMLKARIDSEIAASTAGSHPGSRAMSPTFGSRSDVRSTLSTVREPSSASGSSLGHLAKRPQFLDESHIFWCNSCRGDLVIL